MKILPIYILFLVLSHTLGAQIVTLEPTFPDRDELVTVTYDATQGSGGLEGVQQVYMHTGLITGSSSSGSDWKYVIGNWGTDDPRVKMTNLGGNLHQLSFIINDFYGVPESEEILKLAFVFRNVDGSKEGKTDQGGDIFLDFNSDQGFTGQLIHPTQSVIIANLGDNISIKYATSEIAEITVKDNSSPIYSDTTNLLDYTYVVNDPLPHHIQIEATYQGETISADLMIVINPPQIVEDLPIGTKPGINHYDNGSTRLALLAPGKENVYVLGDFNNWQINTDYFMKKTPNGQFFWIELNDLDPNQNYAFQYLVDGEITIADPFSQLVLDPNNDSFISASTFPNMHPYPSGQANGYVTLMKTGAEDYDWQYEYEPVQNEKLVIYELLMRDFTSEKNYQTLLDTLDYLERLGINAIEFMPVNEFEGNNSWGYNPSFHMALDKYYGTPESFKKLIDECHRREIAVILDVVYNHAFSQSPLAQMYWDAANFRPTSDSPFLNPTAKHPYNVGYDFNHESEHTKLFVETVTQYWLDEYKIDGFRFDLSKGFTQNFSDNDGTFAQYDQSRIDILKNYADKIWEINPDAYLILEHFAANNEEQVLSSYGMMLWNNNNHAFGEGTLGYNANEGSNFEWMDYKKRGWSAPNGVAYMESHDEERLMYKNLNFGNSSSNYNVKDLATALTRMELASAFFYLVPGPKMLWQFGEMGFDFSINRCENGTINSNCRLSPKPIRWDYKEDLNRKRLIDVTSALIKLKTEYDITTTTNYAYNFEDGKKFMRLTSDDLNAIIIGNFEIGGRSLSPGFQHKGIWYDYITGDSLDVTNQLMNIVLSAGEYRVYLDQKIGEPAIISGIEDPLGQVKDYKLYPNPASDYIVLDLALKSKQDISISFYDVSGNKVSEINKTVGAGSQKLELAIESLPTGIYHLVIGSKDFRLVDRLMIID